MNPVKVYDLLILGGGPGGYTAALYAAQAGLDALVVEKLSAGGQMALTEKIENYPGFPDGVDGFLLGEAMEQAARNAGAQTVLAEVREADLAASPKRIVTDTGEFFAKTVILATGANPRLLGVPGEGELTGRIVHYCALCDGMRYRGKTVAVIGGGNSAAADALHLSRTAKKVIVIHRRDTLRADRVQAEKLRAAENVEILYSRHVTGFRLAETAVVETAEGDIPVDGIFVCVGRQPETKLFAGQVSLTHDGYVAAGEDTKTSLPGVYAVGDLRQKPLRQIVTAAADGAVAAHMAGQFLETP